MKGWIYHHARAAQKTSSSYRKLSNNFSLYTYIQLYDSAPLWSIFDVVSFKWPCYPEQYPNCSFPGELVVVWRRIDPQDRHWSGTPPTRPSLSCLMQVVQVVVLNEVGVVVVLLHAVLVVLVVVSGAGWCCMGWWWRCMRWWWCCRWWWWYVVAMFLVVLRVLQVVIDDAGCLMFRWRRTSWVWWRWHG